MLCYKCNISVDGFKNVDFDYDGFDFSIFVSGIICVNCAKQEYIEDFEECGRRIIEKVNGKISVAWDVYIYYYSINVMYASKMNEILMALRIFSTKAKGNWVIMGGGIPTSLGGYWFTRKEDVLEYARLMYSNSFYPCEIWHIDESYLLKQI